MRRKIVAIAAALAFGVLGTTMLIRFVRGAESRALADETLVDVYVVTQPVNAGTPAEQLGASVELQQVPVRVRADGAITDLGLTAGLVTAVDLVPGEQLMVTRLTEPNLLAAARTGRVPAPEGFVEVTLPFEPVRILGGLANPGDLTIVFASFEPFDVAVGDIQIEGEDVPVPAELNEGLNGQTSSTTGVLLHKVLVTEIQTSEAPPVLEDENGEPVEGGPALAPTGSMLVTFALSPADAERLLFAQEYGKLWVGLTDEEVPENGTKIQTRATVYESTTPVTAQ